MTILWLADVLRDGGVEVVEHPGWRTHKRPGTWNPVCGIVHATAAPTWQTDDVQIGIVRNGRSDLIGPIANACVDRRGRWHVLSAGRCNTTLEGTAGPFRGVGNTGALGVEACNDNRGEAWPTVQYEAYARGWAAISRRLGWRADRLVGHKEHTPGHKTDPTFDMKAFRARVTRFLNGEEDDMGFEVVHGLYLKLLYENWSPTKEEWVNAGGTAASYDQLAKNGSHRNALALKLADLEKKLDKLLAQPSVQLTDEQAAQLTNTLTSALIADPNFATMIRQLAFEGAQEAEKK